MIGQYPQAIVLSCVDSRVPVEDVFDLGIGDIFVARVAGNIENEDIVGSMEFATAVAGSKLVIVMGHTACGAVNNAIDKTDAASMEMNALQNLLDEIQPSIARVAPVRDMSSKNESFTNQVIEQNAIQTVEDIRSRSPKMASLEQEGNIKIVAAVYDMASGKVKFL
jgi:carbonic anhydrase